MALALSEPGLHRWSDLRQRAISAVVLAPIVAVGIWAGGSAFTLLVAAMSLGMAAEWIGLCRGRVRAAFWLPCGLLWIGLAGAALVWLRADPSVGRANVIFAVALIWASDIGAYATGRLIGGPRLAPRISPGKTWSGAAGGLVAATAIGCIVAKLLAPSGNLAFAALLAACLSVIGQCGDLLESWIKRHFGVKDSSRLIPGHGGLLDRLDTVLAVMPATALLALALGRGVILWQ